MPPSRKRSSSEGLQTSKKNISQRTAMCDGHALIFDFFEMVKMEGRSRKVLPTD